jgi:hypothetical protein
MDDASITWFRNDCDIHTLRGVPQAALLAPSTTPPITLIQQVGRKLRLLAQAPGTQE